MVELLACRVCLCTNVKLYNIYQYQLHFAYESLTGCKVLPQDGCPQYVCHICSTLLHKWLSFKNVCQKSQEKLKYAYGQNRLITTEYITSLQLSTPYLAKFSTCRSSISLTYNEDKEIKDEVYNDNDHTFNDDTETFADDIDFNNDSDDFNDKKVKSENSSSDEEPLASKKVKKKKRKVKKVNVKSEKQDNGNQDNDEKQDNGNQDNDEKQDNGNQDNNEKQDNGNQENDNDDDNLENCKIELKILTKEQQIEEIESRMKSLNYLHSFYKCEKCYKGFMSAATYNNHMIRHDPSSGGHVCEICHTRWRTSGSLHTHVVAAHERKFVCTLCTHVSNSKYKAKEHFKWHGGHKFVCDLCGASFQKSTSHLTHVRIHHPSEYSCEVCGDSFIGEIGLKMHKRKAHRDVEDEEKKESSRCPSCDVNFHTTDALKKHMTENDCKNIKPCPQCGENFKTEDLLKEHLKIHINTEKVKCDQCNRTFAHERSYANHFHRVHLGVKLKKKCSRNNDRITAVVCEICGKKCINNATLQYHQRTHTGEKPFPCTECPKRFSVYQRLQIHLRIHTGERPYKCKNCPKAFRHKAALNRHDRVHTGVKPYSCSHCGKCFSQSNSMKLHVRTVHLKMPAPYRGRHADKMVERMVE